MILISTKNFYFSKMSTLRQKGYKVDIALDNRILNQPKEYTIFKTGQNLSIQQTSAQTYTSSSVTWNILPSASCWLDRRFRIKCRGRYTLTNPGGVLPAGFTGILAPSADGSLGSLDGLRFMPLQSQCSDVQLQINNGSISTQPSLFFEPLMRYGFDKNYDNTWTSTSPSMHDTAQSYADSYQTNRDPLGGLLSNSVQQPRGSDVFYTVVSNTSTQAVVDCEWEEPFCCVSPMLFPDQSRTGLWDINKINVTFNMQNSMRNSWSHDAVNGTNLAGTISFEWLEAPVISIWQISNPGNLLEREVEKILPFTEIDVFQDSGPLNLASGSSYTQTLSNLRLDGTPSRIYLFCRKNLNSFTYNDCDAYGLIENISINFGVQNSLLNNLFPFDIYQMCLENGYKGSWGDWNSSGSVVCIDFASNISMNLLSAVGMGDQTQMQITVRFKNLSSSSVTYTIYTVVCFEGLLDYSFNQSQTLVNLLQPADLTNEKIVSAAKSRAAHLDVNYMGGNFREKAGSTLKKAVDLGVKYGPKAYKVAKEYVPKARSAVKKYGPTVADAVGVVAPRAAEIVRVFNDLVGKGMSEADAYASLKKIGYPAAEIRAAGITGGKVKPKAKKPKSAAAKPKPRADLHPKRKGRGLTAGRLIDDSSSDCEDLLSGRS